MSVTGNFFSKLRSLAITLEKETTNIEQVFNQEDNEYGDDESPMRVLHDLRSEITGLKNEIHATIDKNVWKGQELISFIKVCKVLQQRTSSDIQQIKDTFQNYGYKPPESNKSDNEIVNESIRSESAEENVHTSGSQDPPPMPALDKLAACDLLRVPQLSDFGLAHYQLHSAWEPQIKKLPITNAPKEKPKPTYTDIRSIQVAKTPKCSLTMEEDFSHIQHFGISDYSTNLNDDYTIALINKKKGSGPEKPKEMPRDLKGLLATPAHTIYRNDFSAVGSPLPPVFCTPGLKVLKKEIDCGLKDGDQETYDVGSAADVSDNTRDMKSRSGLPSYLSLRGGIDFVNSPHPPTFCTPGLKVHRKDMSCETVKPSAESEEVAERLDTPPVPSFETKWLKSDPMARSLDITEPIPRPELSHNPYLEDAADATKPSSPPKMRDFCIGTPPRPEITTCLTEDMFKYNKKMASPPKVSEYENLLWTPTRPEMTTCVTEDISQILSKYCADKGKPSWSMGNKENRP